MRKSVQTALRFCAVFLCALVLLLYQIPQPVKATGAVIGTTGMTWLLISLLALCGVGFAVAAQDEITQAIQDSVDDFEQYIIINYPGVYSQLQAQVPPDPPSPIGFTFLLSLSTFLPIVGIVNAYFGRADAETGQGNIESAKYTVISLTEFPSELIGNINPLNDLYLYEGDSAVIDVNLKYAREFTNSVEYWVTTLKHELTYSDGVLTCVRTRFHNRNGVDIDPYIQTFTYQTNNNYYVRGSDFAGDYINVVYALYMSDSLIRFLSPYDDVQLNKSALFEGADFLVEIKQTGLCDDYGVPVVGDVVVWNDIAVYTTDQVRTAIETSPETDDDGNPVIGIGVGTSLPQTQTDVMPQELIDLLEQIRDNTSPGTGGDTPNYPTQDFLSPPATATNDDVDDLKAPALIFQKFPFCIPWDLFNAFNVLQAEAVAPVFVFTIPINYSIIGGADSEYEIELDFTEYETAIAVFRWCVLLTFVVGLILVTRKLIGN